MTQTFILLTRLVSEEVHPSFFIEEKSKAVEEKIKESCPAVSWISNFAVVGPWDYLDIFEAPDLETALQVKALVRSYGGAHVELWPAMPWDNFKETIRVLQLV